MHARLSTELYVLKTWASATGVTDTSALQALARLSRSSFLLCFVCDSPVQLGALLRAGPLDACGHVETLEPIMILHPRAGRGRRGGGLVQDGKLHKSGASVRVLPRHCSCP